VGVTANRGQGSCFWAELPLPRAATAGAATPRRAGRPDGDRLRGARVLMVEDNAVNMLIAVAMLERWGVRVDPGQDGREAVDAVSRPPPPASPSTPC
jgi:hypothetical protein